MSPETPARRGRVLLECGALVALAAASVLRATPGTLEAALVLASLALLLAGGVFRRALVLLGRAEPAPLALSALEIAALVGVARDPTIHWAHGLVGVAALALALEATPPGSAATRAGWVEEGVVLALALGIGAKAWLLDFDALLLDLDALPLMLPFALLAVFAIEAFGPRAPRTSADAARRVAALGILAAGVGLRGMRASLLGVSLEDACLALASVAAAGAARRVWARTTGATASSEAPEPGPARPRLARAVAIALGGVLALGVASLTAARFAAERRVDLATAGPRLARGHDCVAVFSRLSPFYVPESATLLEDGTPLPFGRAEHGAVADVGSGRSAILAGRIVHWSSRDNTDPLTNGRRYELAFTPEVYRSLPGRALFGLAGVLLFAAWSLGAVRLRAPSPLGQRVALVVVTLAALGAGLPRGWDETRVEADTGSYLTHASMRPLLYPGFVDRLDRRPQEVRAFSSDPARVPDPDRFVNVVRAQKVLAALAVATLVWVLAGTLNAWLVALLAYLAVMADVRSWGDLGASFNVGALLSEGLNHSLVLFYVAAAFGYLRQPSWWRGLALSLVLALLVLNRPANLSLVLVLAFAFVRHLESGRLVAVERTLWLVVALALPLLLASWSQERRTGHARLHTATGMHVFSTAFETASTDDVASFEDPRIRGFLSACLADRERFRAADAGTEQNYVDRNIYQIALPELGRFVTFPAGEQDFGTDDTLFAIGRHLIARHPWAFARLVGTHLSKFVSWHEQGPIALVVLIGGFLYWRTRSWLWLAFVFFALLPITSMLPACVFNFPIARYRSQLAFAEVLTLPLFGAVLATLADERSRARPRTEGAASPLPRP